MKNFKPVITGVKMIIPVGLDLSKEPGNRLKQFDMETFFPQGLPRRLAGLDRGSKYLLAAVKEALSGRATIDSSHVGVAVATLLGSNPSRLKFLQGVLREESPAADPMAFKTTVPSVAAGAVAIMYHCYGPSLTCVGHGEAGLAALHNACLLLQRGMAKEMIVGGYEELPDELLNLVPQQLKGPKPWLEGAAALVLKNNAAGNLKGEKMLARVSGFGLSGQGSKLEQKKNALRKAMEASVWQAEPPAIDAIVSAGPRYLAVEKGMFPGIPVIDTTSLWGETLGMFGIVGLVTAVDMFNKAEESLHGKGMPANILVNGVGVAGAAYSVMLSRP